MMVLPPESSLYLTKYHLNKSVCDELHLGFETRVCTMKSLERRMVKLDCFSPHSSRFSILTTGGRQDSSKNYRQECFLCFNSNNSNNNNDTKFDDDNDNEIDIVANDINNDF